MRLLVTGGRSGYLGRYVVRAAAGHDVIAVGSADADLRDHDAVRLDSTLAATLLTTRLRGAREFLAT